jgi:hypothetical protein
MAAASLITTTPSKVCHELYHGFLSILMTCVGPFVNALLEARNRNPGSSLATFIDGFLTVQVACTPTTSPSEAKIIAAACDPRKCKFSRDIVLLNFVGRTGAK